MKFEYSEEFSCLTNVIMNITDGCNLSCRYCFVEQHPHFMDLETAKIAVDWMYKNLLRAQDIGLERNDCGLTFFGGEPLLLYDKIIVPIINYCDQKYPDKFKFGITTNGTLLTKEKVDFFVDHNITPLLSIDGAKQTQDYNRPTKTGESSFDLVYKNIPYLLEKIPMTVFRSTIDQNTVEHTFENYLFAEQLGFVNYYTMPNEREKWSQENKIKLAHEVEKMFRYMSDKFLNDKLPIDFSRIDEIYEYLLQRDIYASTNGQLYTPPPMRSVLRCGLGTVSGSIGYDGKVYGCQEQDSRDEKTLFHIGDIFSGIDIEKHTKLLEKYFNSINPICEDSTACIDCILKPICHFKHSFNCPANAFDLFNDFNISSEMCCFWYQLLAENCLIMQKILTDNNNLLFKEYLQQACNYKKYFINKPEE